MTKLEKILRDLYKDGKINFSEMAAILGCCETQWDREWPQAYRDAGRSEKLSPEKFREEYGHSAFLGLQSLFVKVH